MRRTVVCSIECSDQAQAIVRQLRAIGFLGDDIAVLFPTQAEATRAEIEDRKSRTPEAAVAGAGTGGIVGGALGFLAGIGVLVCPGLLTLASAGPMLTAIGGAAVGVALGGFAGALAGTAVPEHKTRLYQGLVRGGRIVLAVHAEDGTEREQAEEIFRRWGARDIATAIEMTE
jgi:hypothetical protein